MSPAWDRKHLLQLEGLSAAELIEILDSAESYREAASGRGKRLELLAEKTIGNLFFEDSTRTRCSFAIAARRLGADTIDLSSAGSSVNKGETIVDTARNLHAMGVHGFIVRTSAAGAVKMLADAVEVPVINAGDGRHEHPTQGLLDLLTLRQRLGQLKGRTIGIVGDINNSRVARSDIHGLTTLGTNVLLIGPPTLVSQTFQSIAAGPGRVSVSHDLDAAIPDVDSIIMLRVQFERTGTGTSPITGDYRELFGLTAARASRLPEHAAVLHPGPMNRGLEIDSEVADESIRSAILQQVSNGVAVRMAVLAMLMCRD